MKEVGISSDRNCSSSFEAQISKLYSRSLFLRTDELKALQRSARIIDQQAARQFVLHTTLTAEANQTLANIIIKFRVNQASRQDDAETLAALRKKVLEYRKSVLSSWFVTKAFKKLFRDDIEKKHKRIVEAAVESEMTRAELRHTIARKLIRLFLCSAEIPSLSEMQQQEMRDLRSLALRKIALIEKQKFLKDRLRKVQTDQRILDTRGP